MADQPTAGTGTGAGATGSRPPRGGGGGGDRDGRGRRDDRGGRGGRDGGEKSNFLERVVAINRVAKVVKGGRRFSFTALVILGDGNGMVGVGYGKAKEVPAAIQKGAEEARKNFFRVPLIGSTIPHPIQAEEAAGVVMLRPASPGTGARRLEVRRYATSVEVAHPTTPSTSCATVEAPRACSVQRSRPAAVCRWTSPRGPAARSCGVGASWPAEDRKEVLHRRQAEPP